MIGMGKDGLVAGGGFNWLGLVVDDPVVVTTGLECEAIPEGVGARWPWVPSSKAFSIPPESKRTIGESGVGSLDLTGRREPDCSGLYRLTLRTVLRSSLSHWRPSFKHYLDYQRRSQIESDSHLAKHPRTGVHTWPQAGLDSSPV